MFRNCYQKGLLTVFSSTGSKPLATWSVQVQNGHIKRLTDQEICSLVLEIIGRNVATTFIQTPCGNFTSLGIKLPFLVLIVKNLKKFFSFEIQILDDRYQLRRFRVSNYQSTTRVKPFCTSMPLCLSQGWNQIQFNLADFVRRAYATNYVETVRIQIHANVRIRRIYFSDRLYEDHEKPPEFRLYKTLDQKKPKMSRFRPSSRPRPTTPDEQPRPGTPVSDVGVQETPQDGVNPIEHTSKEVQEETEVPPVEKIPSELQTSGSPKPGPSNENLETLKPPEEPIAPPPSRESTTSSAPPPSDDHSNLDKKDKPPSGTLAPIAEEAPISPHQSEIITMSVLVRRNGGGDQISLGF